MPGEDKKKETAKKAASKKATSKAAKEVKPSEKTSKAAKTKKTTAKKVETKTKVTSKTVKKADIVSKKQNVKKTDVKKQSAKKRQPEKLNKNKTFFLKHKEIEKKWLILDAAGKPLGRVAAFAASLLRGKHKVLFTPNVDCGDNVIIINCKDTILTGKKLEQKVRYRHSGWIGGLKEIKYSDLMKKSPQKAMEFAVKGMLPKNSLGAKMAKHLKVYQDENHEQQAQKPELVNFEV